MQISIQLDIKRQFLSIALPDGEGSIVLHNDKTFFITLRLKISYLYELRLFISIKKVNAIALKYYHSAVALPVFCKFIKMRHDSDKYAAEPKLKSRMALVLTGIRRLVL